MSSIHLCYMGVYDSLWQHNSHMLVAMAAHSGHLCACNMLVGCGNMTQQASRHLNFYLGLLDTWNSSVHFTALYTALSGVGQKTLFCIICVSWMLRHFDSVKLVSNQTSTV